MSTKQWQKLVGAYGNIYQLQLRRFVSLPLTQSSSKGELEMKLRRLSCSCDFEIFTECRIYGDRSQIMSVQIFNGHIVVLNSPEQNRNCF